MILIGNKSDLKESRLISTEEGEIIAKENDLLFLETSALTSENINLAFETIFQEIYRDIPKKNLQTTNNNSGKPTGTTIKLQTPSIELNSNDNSLKIPQIKKIPTNTSQYSSCCT